MFRVGDIVTRTSGTLEGVRMEVMSVFPNFEVRVKFLDTGVTPGGFMRRPGDTFTYTKDMLRFYKTRKVLHYHLSLDLHEVPR